MEPAPFDLGKKVFFLNTPATFQEIVIPMLSSSGYEVYSLNSYRHTKAILKEFPSSVLYVCIDTELVVDQWYNFITSFSRDPILKDVIIGIMSSNAAKTEVDHFLLNTSIPGGFVSLSQQDIIIHDYIHSILHLNDAKGKRNFVRVNCLDETNISATLLTKSGTKILNVSNISSAGLLCITDHKNEALFVQSKVLNNLIIDLNGRKIKCDMLLYKTYTEGDNLFLVLLFATDLPYAIRSIIDKYVRDLLQARLESVIEKLPEDFNNYSRRQKSVIGQDTDEAFLIDE